MDDDIFGIVLAGGRSSRLTGLDLGDGGKAALVVGGAPCLGRVCGAVAAVVPRVIVVAAAGQPVPLLDSHVEIIRDTTPHAGPLAGIRDGLAHGMSYVPPPRWAFVASCDVPLLVPAVVRLLVDRARASAAAGPPRWKSPAAAERHPETCRASPGGPAWRSGNPIPAGPCAAARSAMAPCAKRA